MPVANLDGALKHRGRRLHQAGAVNRRAKQVAAVNANAQALQRFPTHTQIELRDVARTGAVVALVVKRAAETIAHAGVWQQAERAAQMVEHAELRRDIVQATAKTVAALRALFRPQVGEVDAHVPQESQRVDLRIRGGVHRVDGARVLHGISHTTHRALDARSVVVEQAVANARIRTRSVLCPRGEAASRYGGKQRYFIDFHLDKIIYYLIRVITNHRRRRRWRSRGIARADARRHR